MRLRQKFGLFAARSITEWEAAKWCSQLKSTQLKRLDLATTELVEIVNIKQVDVKVSLEQVSLSFELLVRCFRCFHWYCSQMDEMKMAKSTCKVGQFLAVLYIRASSLTLRSALNLQPHQLNLPEKRWQESVRREAPQMTYLQLDTFKWKIESILIFFLIRLLLLLLAQTGRLKRPALDYDESTCGSN